MTKVFGTENEYFLGERRDLEIDEAQERAATEGEDQNADPETSEAEVRAIYEMTGMDPSAWKETER